MNKGASRTPRKKNFITVLSWLFIPPSPLIIRHPWQTSQCCPQPYGSRLPLVSIGILQSYYIKQSFIHLISPELSPPTAVWSFVTPVPWSSADFPVVCFMQITSHKFINSPWLHECKLPHFTKYCIYSSLQVPSHCWWVCPQALEFMESHWL